MPVFHVTVTSTHPRTIIEEVIEIEANDAAEAKEYVMMGDGYQMSTKTSYGDAEVEIVDSVVEV